MTADGTRQISAQEATIRTATIEVRTLTLNGKQMTLSVFRQLKEESLLKRENPGTLAGQPWGWVNYHPDCKTTRPHLHIVWQHDSFLRRALVLQSPWADEETETSEHWGLEEAAGEQCLLFLYARTLEGWSPEKKVLPQRRMSKEDTDIWPYYTFTVEGRRLQPFIQRQYAEALTHIWSATKQEGPLVSKARSLLEEQITSYYHKRQGQPIRAETLWDEEVVPAVARLQAYEREWLRLYAELEALGQLFIAV